MLITVKKEKLIKKLNLESLNKSQIEKVWPLIVNLYQTKFLNNLLSLLPEEDKKKLLLLLSENDDKKTRNFLNSRISKLDIKLEEIKSSVEQELLEDVLSVNNAKK